MEWTPAEWLPSGVITRWSSDDYIITRIITSRNGLHPPYYAWMLTRYNDDDSLGTFFYLDQAKAAAGKENAS